MRIAMLAPLVTPIREPQQGGAQAVVADLAAGLTARGHEVDVFAARGSSIPGANVIDTGVHSEDLAASLFRHNRPAVVGPEVPQAFARAYRLVTRGRYDLVHGHAFDAPAIMLGTDTDIPVIHTLHLPPDPTIASALRAASLSRQAPVVATVSRSSAELWSRYVRVDAILKNGVPLDRIPWTREGGEGALFAGRFSSEKGALEAVEVAQMAEVPLTLIGNPYEPAYFSQLQDRCRSEPLVTLESAVPRTELWGRMRTSSVVLCPSRWDEPFGLVAAEAQASGTPVVAFARGGLVEVVADQVTGALIPDGNLEAAAGAVSRVGSFDRVACRRHAEATLNLEATLDAHEDLYQIVAARQSRDALR
ncbi:MAG TPA: glycosyltransferase [Actinomycetota bacterium]|nr:glycosyltransferase [Actinomycetota bacterium]